MRITTRLMAVACVGAALAGAARRPRTGDPTPLDAYIAEAGARGGVAVTAGPGSLYTPGAPLANLAGDVTASRVDDVVTILVVESASAVSKGTVQTSRQSAVTSSVGALGGATAAAGPWAQLAQAGTASKLDGQGATTRQTALSTTLAARVTHVLPNGYLVLEGSKDLQVNSEHQHVRVRGVARPEDIVPGNLVRSDRLAQLEVRINGKGVVGDAIRRPFFLYRLLLGLLPF